MPKDFLINKNEKFIKKNNKKQIMKEKSQLSVFFIFIFVMLVAVSLLIYSNTTKIKKLEKDVTQIKKIPFSFEAVKSGIDLCIKQTAEDAVVYTGFQGGYYNLPQESMNDYFYETAYYFYEKQNIMPSTEVIQREISQYINEYLDFCMIDLVDIFPQYNFSLGDIGAESLITSDGLIVKVDYPVTIKQDKTIQKTDKFIVTLRDIRLKDIHDAVTELMVEQLKEPNLICTSCLVNIGEKYNLYFDLERINSSTVIFTVIDRSNELYYFTFANEYGEYTCDDPSMDTDTSFYIDCVKK